MKLHAIRFIAFVGLMVILANVLALPSFVQVSVILGLSAILVLSELFYQNRSKSCGRRKETVRQ